MHPLEGQPAFQADEEKELRGFLDDRIVVPVHACFIDISPAEGALVDADFVWDGRRVRFETPDVRGWPAFTDCVETAVNAERGGLRKLPPVGVRVHTYQGVCGTPL